MTESRWRTGAPRRELALTFVGCIFYLDDLEKSKTRDPEKIQTLTSKYGGILDYPPFSEYEEINRALPNEGPDMFCSVASLLLRGLDEPPRCAWNLVTFELREEKLRALWPKEEDEIRRLKSEQEKLWMNEFATLLLRPSVVRASRPIYSPKLNSFYKGVLEERMRAMQQDLEKTRELVRTIDTRVRPKGRPTKEMIQEAYRKLGLSPVDTGVNTPNS